MRLRILIAVTHLLGAGHLTRAAAIGRALARRGHAVTLVSGGTPAGLVDMSGLDLVQLAPVRAAVGDFTTLRDEAGHPASAALLDDRRERLLAAFAMARPDVVVTELFPFGRRSLAGEFGALLDAAEAARPRPVAIASVRDILAPPSRPAKAEATHLVLRRHYAAVLVHGDPALLPLDLSWPVDDALRSRLIYTGYVGPDAAPPLAAGSREDTVLVSGGSSAASLPLYRAALGAAAASARRWHVLVGAGVAEAAFRALGTGLPDTVVLERARPDFRDLLSKTAVFVGQAGYNTVMDIVATQARSVLVPFEGGRETEQRMRAEALSARGLATLLPERELDPGSLARAVEAAARLPRPDLSAIRLDGAEVAARRIEGLVEDRRTGALREERGAR